MNSFSAFTAFRRRAPNAPIDDNPEKQKAKQLKGDNRQKGALLIFVKLHGERRKFVHGDICPDDGNRIPVFIAHGTRVRGHEDNVIAAHVGLAPESVTDDTVAVPGTFRVIETDDRIRNVPGLFVHKSEVAVAHAVIAHAVGKVDTHDFGMLAHDPTQGTVQGILLSEGKKAFHLGQHASDGIFRNAFHLDYTVGGLQVALRHFFDLRGDGAPHGNILHDSRKFQHDCSRDNHSDSL